MQEVSFCESILEFNNGAEALDGLKKRIANGMEFPSVIFLDLNMPIMNGWDFLEDFMQFDPGILKKVTIYIISSSIDPRDLERVRMYKYVSGYILKPITPKDLDRVRDAYAEQ